MKKETRIEDTTPRRNAEHRVSPQDAIVSTTAVRRIPSESMIDLTLDQSFPASDPPSWTLGI
jgi:hypothetical protein